MKAKNVLDKLKDLKLRRWGPAEYTEAKNSNGGGSGQIDYETIYQFYKQKFIESIPEQSLEQFLEQTIIPEHYTDIEPGIGISAEYENKTGIWYSDTIIYNLREEDIELFCEIRVTPFPTVVKRIYIGTYKTKQM